jgi:hypothetical protein
MNRKAMLVTSFALLLAFLLFASVQSIMAGTVGPLRLKSGVTVYSPVNAVYNSKIILFNYTFAVGMGMHYSLNYMLDGSETQPMPYSVLNPQELHVVYSALGQVQLPELSEGPHSLTISLEASFGNDIRSYSDTIYFTIDTNAPDVILDALPPKITIHSPQTNQTYTTGVPLNLLLSEPATQLILHLDGNKTTLPPQNTTLTGLTKGTHTLTITALDLAGNPGYTNYVTFNLIQPTPTQQPTPTPATSEHPTTNTGAEQPQTDPFPTSPVLAAIIVVVIVAAAGLLVQYKKHKRRLFSGLGWGGLRISNPKCNSWLLTAVDILWCYNY